MTMDEVLFGLGNLVLIALTMGFWAFILLFHVLADWRASQSGRHFMAFMFSCAVTLTWSVFAIFVPLPRTVLLASRIPIFGALSWVVWKHTHTLIRTQLIARGSAHEILEGRDGTAA